MLAKGKSFSIFIFAFNVLKDNYEENRIWKVFSLLECDCWHQLGKCNNEKVLPILNHSAISKKKQYHSVNWKLSSVHILWWRHWRHEGGNCPSSRHANYEAESVSHSSGDKKSNPDHSYSVHCKPTVNWSSREFTNLKRGGYIRNILDIEC